MYFVVAFIFFVAGFTTGWFNHKRSQKPLMFRWECLEAGCVFKVASDNPEMTLGLADHHVDLQHKKNG